MNQWFTNFVIVAIAMGLITIVGCALYAIAGWYGILALVIFFIVAALIALVWTLIEWHQGINKW